MLAKAVYQSKMYSLTHRIREQARSHILPAFRQFYTGRLRSRPDTTARSGNPNSKCSWESRPNARPLIREPDAGDLTHHILNRDLAHEATVVAVIAVITE